MKKNNLFNIVKKVILSSTPVLLFNNTNAEPIKNNTNVDSEIKFSGGEYGIKSKFHFPSFILHRADAPDDYAMSHRSHRSHSSHRSHYSSYSNPTPKKSETPKVQPKQKTTQSEQLPNTSARLVYEFGSRILKHGMVGTDVAELQEILKKLDFTTGKIDGNFGDSTENAVKKYQRSVDVEETGVVNVLTFYHLKKAKDALENK